jgi:hypothetical protein
MTETYTTVMSADINHSQFILGVPALLLLASGESVGI